MKKLTFLFSILLVQLSMMAQNDATVRGFITNAEDGNSVPFVKVFIDSINVGANTDFNGFYSIPGIPAGTYTLSASSVEHVTYTKEITLKAGQILQLNIELEKGKMLDAVEVSSESRAKKTEVQTSVIKITSKDILRVPTTGGDADIATYFQTVPGVVSTGDQGGQVYVRGGTPIQNKMLLDGMTIYNPFHSIGFFSVFETDLVQTADIYTGGFNAKYGGRISSVMDVKYRSGNSKKFSGMVGASPFSSKVLLEGPLSKKNDISFVLSSKFSMLEQTSKVLYPYINDGEGLPFNFTDIYGKITVGSKSGSKFNLFGFSFNDQVQYQSISDLHWNSYGGGMNFAFVPQSSKLYVQGRFNLSSYSIVLEEDELQPRTSSMAGAEMAFDFTYFLKGRSQLDYGFGLIILLQIFLLIILLDKTSP